MKSTKQLILLGLILVTPLSVQAQEEGESGWYSQLSVTVWTRNFEEATPTKDNTGVEKTEGGFVPGLGYKKNNNWSFELEFLPTMDFTVESGGRTGRINMIAITVAPKYTFDKRFFNDKLSFFLKFRAGWAQIIGTSFYGNSGSNSSLTLGPAFGADYSLNKSWQGYIDIGGLWASGDIEDYDFHPWQFGLRYFF